MYRETKNNTRKNGAINSEVEIRVKCQVLYEVRVSYVYKNLTHTGIRKIFKNRINSNNIYMQYAQLHTPYVITIVFFHSYSVRFTTKKIIWFVFCCMVSLGM